MDATGPDMQAVQNFLRLAKGAQNKDDYISRVRQFDQKFIDAYPAPIITPLPNIPRSNTQSSQKPQIFQPPKNPFITPAEQKHKQTQRQASQSQLQFQAQIPPYPSSMPQSIPQPPRSQNRQTVQQIPHTRSETNFYRLDQEPPFFEDVNATYAQEFYNNQQNYRQNMANRAYSNLDRNRYGQTQPYIQGNQYLANYETQEPQYVKYYKKVIPQAPPKQNFTPTSRSNPFKQP